MSVLTFLLAFIVGAFAIGLTWIAVPGHDPIWAVAALAIVVTVLQAYCLSNIFRWDVRLLDRAGWFGASLGTSAMSYVYMRNWFPWMVVQVNNRPGGHTSPHVIPMASAVTYMSAVLTVAITLVYAAYAIPQAAKKLDTQAQASGGWGPFLLWCLMVGAGGGIALVVFTFVAFIYVFVDVILTFIFWASVYAVIKGLMD